MVSILYAKVTQSKEIYCVERTSNQRSHSTTVGAEINGARKKVVGSLSSVPIPTRPKFTDTYWIIAPFSDIPYGKVSFTRQEARLFRTMFKDSRLIWAGRKPVQCIEEISIPKGGVNITPPSTITNIVTVQGVAHV